MENLLNKNINKLCSEITKSILIANHIDTVMKFDFIKEKSIFEKIFQRFLQ